MRDALSTLTDDPICITAEYFMNAKDQVSYNAHRNYVSGKSITCVKTLSAYRNKCCFIIGGGASLRTFDFSLLHDKIVVGINKSFLRVTHGILYLSDVNLYESIHVDQDLLAAWNAFAGTRVLMAPQIDGFFAEDVYLVKRRQDIGISSSLDEGIYPGNNSGFGALMLACALGLNPIYLLGYDMRCVQRTHWHDGYDGQSVETQREKLPKFVAPFVRVAPALHSVGVRVINLSAASALPCFPKKDISYIFEVLR